MLNIIVRKRMSQPKKSVKLWENILYRSDKIIAEPVKKDNQLCPGILSGLLSPRITIYE